MTDAPSDRGSLTRDGTWSEPQRDWLTIARAVFRFAITHTDGQRSLETYQEDSDPFSIEAFKKFKSRQNKADADIIDAEAGPLSLHNLTLTLRDEAGACSAEIDLDNASFKFAFDLPAGGSATIGFAPWHLPLRGPVEIDPRLEREALFNRGNGLVMIRDEEAKLNAQLSEAVRAATSFVWNQLMLPDFDRSVSSGRVKVYARVQSRLAQFQQLPAELWSRLKVLYWYDGVARDPEGNRYYSIHAADSLPRVPPTQVSIMAVETAATKALGEELERNPNLTREQASDWCETYGHHLTYRGFLNRVWPAARVKAGLQSAAPPGRPKKSTH
jgi:hypothetical protein